jgi:hypothetical protein
MLPSNFLCDYSQTFSYELKQLPVSINSSQIKYFHEFLCDRHFHPPFNSRFAVVIDPENKDYLLDQLGEIGGFYLLSQSKWEFENAQYIDFNQDRYHRTIGNIFTNAVQLPQESNSFITAGSGNGFLKTPIFTDRTDFTPLAMSFFETSTSFVDLILRPWTMLVARKGLVAREQSESIKATITVYQMDLADDDDGIPKPQRIRKIWRFYKCIPQSISPDVAGHDQNKINIRQASFVYSDYDLADVRVDL